MIAAITVEYNPLHNGHIYHIEQTKRLLCELAPNEDNSVIAIMSGGFTQHGNIAVANKFTRAKHAILAGCDMVIELPTIYATSSAEYFANGGMQIASKIKNLGLICFGAECDDIATLEQFANITISDEYNTLIKEFVNQGLSYTIASENAIKKLIIGDPKNSFFAGYSSKIDTKCIFSPNNMLGIEYIKQAKKVGITAKLVPIKRVGSGYNEQNLSEDFNSATAIRNAIESGENDITKLKIPQYIFDDLQNCKIDYDKLFAIVASKCLTLNSVYEDNEGIINRLKKYSQIAKCYNELVELVHTKRYTKSKIKRVIAHIALAHTNADLVEIGKPNVLAVNKDKKHLLSLIDFDGDDICLNQNIFANKIYNIVSDDKITSNNMQII